MLIEIALKVAHIVRVIMIIFLRKPHDLIKFLLRKRELLDDVLAVFSLKRRRIGLLGELPESLITQNLTRTDDT